MRVEVGGSPYEGHACCIECAPNVGYGDITNIATSAVCPTNVSNPTREQAEERMKAMHRLDIPYIEPSEMPDVTMFFAFDAARCISGGALAVSGGPIAMNAG
jgi:hypothetical protein